MKVASIPALLRALADDAVTEIVVANGTYFLDGAANKTANSLWIGSRFAGRTRPVVVRAETTGQVVFDGSNSNYFGGISFQEGAHHQTWEGFVFANGSPNESGVIVFGGYATKPGAHHITLRDITVADSVADRTKSPFGHIVYFSHSAGGAHDILIDGLDVNVAHDRIGATLHFYHSDDGAVNCWNVTVRNMHVTGGSEAGIMVWDATVRNIVIEDSTITGARYGVRYELGGTLTLRRVTSTDSTVAGFYSSLGKTPPGVTFEDSSLR